ncbi:hypothetical protein ACQ4PT_053385 [Festuca glaucescens]
MDASTAASPSPVQDHRDHREMGMVSASANTSPSISSPPTGEAAGVDATPPMPIPAATAVSTPSSFVEGVGVAAPSPVTTPASTVGAMAGSDATSPPPTLATPPSPTPAASPSLTPAASPSPTPAVASSATPGTEDAVSPPSMPPPRASGTGGGDSSVRRSGRFSLVADVLLASCSNIFRPALMLFICAACRFNIVGQWAVTTSVDYPLAQLIQVIILLSTGGANGGGYLASKYVVIAIHAAILLSHTIINSLPISLLSFFGQFAAAWNMLGVFVLMIAVPTVATERASAKFVFTHFNTDNSAGIHSNLYIFVPGLLMSQYTLLGYDASAHMTEETKNADRNGPIGIISAIGVLPSVQEPDGSGVGGIVCLGIVAVAIYFCGMRSVTSNSRMAYAFSRDGAMPLSSVWQKVNKHEVPINVVWLSAFISLCMALPSLGSLVAFQAMVSIATIGLYIAYALPIFFRVTLAREYFVPGPFNLGRYGVVVGWVAVLWVATITVLFSLPVTYPVTKDTLNYTPVAVGGLFILVLASWIFSARHWFKGPVANLGG